MTWQSWVLVVSLIAFIIAQWMLAWSAIVDLLHRPTVRGNSHTFWVLVIIAVPVIGPIVYGAMGPTSLRSQHLVANPQETTVESRTTTGGPGAEAIGRRTSPSSGNLVERMPAKRPGLTRSRAHHRAPGGRRKQRSEE